jgi:hypothetical protein
MFGSSLRPSSVRWPVAILSMVAVVAMAAPAYASGGGGGGSDGGGGGGAGASPVLRSITFSPASVTGGGGDTATVTLSGPAPEGAVVSLTSSDPAVAGFDVSVVQDGDDAVLPPGHSSAAFAVVTTAVPAATPVTITATTPGSAPVSATITVSPGRPPAADAVHITRLQWNHGILTTEATSSNPNAVLNVFDQDGTWLGITLTSEGGGKFQDQREEVFPPDQPIVVESNFGGSATATAQISS